MNKIGIVFIGDLLYCPYINEYIRILEGKNKSYDVLYWNRSGKESPEDERFLSFNKPSKLKKNKVSKLTDFFQYRQWLVRILYKNKYEKIIILSTLSGIILLPELMRMKGKYLFDIRDYSYEFFHLFYMAEKCLIKFSALTIISSKGFECFLPKHNYLYTHNLSVDNRDAYREYTLKKRNNQVINVVWMGAMRYFDYQKKLIKHLANDKRFELYYYGDGAEMDEYLFYTKENKYSNVHILGAYDNANKDELIRDADLLNNSYGPGNETKYALSNKFYDGAFYHIPQIVETDTYKSSLAKKYGIGKSIDINNIRFADELYDWYVNIDTEQFNKGCNALMSVVLEQLQDTQKEIESFLE